MGTVVLGRWAGSNTAATSFPYGTPLRTEARNETTTIRRYPWASTIRSARAALTTAAVAACALLVAGCQISSESDRRACVTPDNATRVVAGGECLVIKTFNASVAHTDPILVVFIHGDVSSGGPATYHAKYAARARDIDKRVVSVAMLRPGYYDDQGNTSSGDNFDRRDSYTPHNVDAIAGALRVLKQHHRARRLVAVGHSGGANIIGVIVGRHPGLVDAAALVSCACNISAWRANRSDWWNSLSPHRFVAKVPTTTEVIAITGSNDTNTEPGLAEDYVASLTKRGVPARFVIVEGVGHSGNRLFTSAVFKNALHALIIGTSR